MPHAGFALAAQDSFQTYLVIRLCPEKVPPRLGIHVRETVGASGTHGNMMRRTGARLETTAYRARIVPSEAEFGDTEWRGTRHGAKCTRECHVHSELCIPQNPIQWSSTNM